MVMYNFKTFIISKELRYVCLGLFMCFSHIELLHTKVMARIQIEIMVIDDD